VAGKDAPGIGVAVFEVADVDALGEGESGAALALKA
jgi:hypothetical protein